MNEEYDFSGDWYDERDTFDEEYPADSTSSLDWELGPND